MAFPRNISLLLLSLLTLTSACKSVPKENLENSEEKGVIHDTVNPRLGRNSDTPWVNWQWYYGARDDTGNSNGGAPLRIAGVAKALIDLDTVRVDLIQNNLIDTNGTLGETPTRAPYRDHKGEKKMSVVWPSMQDGKACGERVMANPNYRVRTLDGRCNDFDNAPMGSVGERFPRNVDVATANAAYKNFDANGLTDPNPRVVSQELLKRNDPFQHAPAPFFNLWAGAWIQFMTHDWFSHAKDGNNDNTRTMKVSEDKVPADQRVGSNGTWTVAKSIPDNDPHRGAGARPSKTFRNTVSHWWDGSQIYGWNAETRARVIDPSDPAKLLLDANGNLPLVTLPNGTKQEATAFTDNWWVGLSLLTTAFAREHNYIVDQLRDPKNRSKARPPSGAAEWTDEELFDVARLSVSGVIAKIHTIEWTPQLLFNHVLDKGMHANWNGLLGDVRNKRSTDIEEFQRAATGLAKKALISTLNRLQRVQAEELIALLAGTTGMVGMKHSEHFGSPFALPEEFTAVYRLHSLLPDYIEIYDAEAASNGQFRALSADELTSRLPTTAVTGPAANRADYWWRPTNSPTEGNMISLVDTLREKSFDVVHNVGIDNLALTFGLTPVGQLTLGNFPAFMTDLKVPGVPGGKIDLAAMDLLRDRERGVPRFNEFRRQIHLKPLKSIDDFVDKELMAEIKSGKGRDLNSNNTLSPAAIAAKKAALAAQQAFVVKLKTIYGNDIEKVDLQVGILAEFTRPHGYAISETQFQIFILNASRRLFSDRFLTEAYTPEFYTQVGFDYVNQTTMVDILKRSFPKLSRPLQGVENAFDVWSRERDEYSLGTAQRPDFLN
ncbi:MAG: hypothetical protein EOP10_00560 [Proteobacteria bacterium]|nr:MAG: hypothetical protein EOP10_00560 [Pseudomonadota bacterium]